MAAAALVAVAAGCSSGTNSNCRGGVGDAGSAPRGLGEPCSDGAACQPGLSCHYLSGSGSGVAPAECLPACGDGGSCAAGTACYDLLGEAPTLCHPTCATSADCSGRFDRVCLGLDGGAGPGVCVVRSCMRGAATCAAGGACVTAPDCCPPGAPCAAPPDGVCLR